MRKDRAPENLNILRKIALGRIRATGVPELRLVWKVNAFALGVYPGRAHIKKEQSGILGMVFWEGSHGATTITNAHYDLFLRHTGPPDRAKQAVSLNEVIVVTILALVIGGVKG